MTDFLVKHTGSNTAPYDTWAKAATTLETARAAMAAGDRALVSNNHSESTAGAISYNWPGTVSAPSYVICVNDGAEPPTATASGGQIATTGANAITIAAASDYVHFEGLTFVCGSGASAANIVVSGASVTAKNCTFHLATSGANARVTATGQDYCRLESCSFKFGATSHGFGVGTLVRIVGGSVLSGGTSPANLITNATGGHAVFDSFDMSNCSSSMNMMSAAGPGQLIDFRNCKMPASWSGSLHSGTPGAGFRMRMLNCDSGDTNYKLRYQLQFGSLADETTIKRTNGDEHLGTGLSWKLITTANAEYPALTLDSEEIVVPISASDVGVSKTLTFHFVHDSVTNLKDDQIWVELQEPGNSGSTLYSVINDAKATYLTAAADQSASSETWTTTGMTNPNKQQVSVTFTPQEEGLALARVRVAVASKTLYLDADPELS